MEPTRQNQPTEPAQPSQTQPSENASPSTQLYGKQPTPVQSKSWAKSWALPLKIVLFPLFVLILIWEFVENGFENLVEGTFIDKFRGGVFGTLELILGAVILAFVINGFVFQSYQVVGQSMAPTLQNGDRLLVNKLGKTWSSVTRSEYIPKRGDIIVFKSPLNEDRQLVKRVIGIAGDRVELKKGVFTIRNDENPEGFNPDDMLPEDIPVDSDFSIATTVNEGELFVSGDNRIGGASLDSRNDLGLVQTDSVIGDLIVRVLPLNESRFF